MRSRECLAGRQPCKAPRFHMENTHTLRYRENTQRTLTHTHAHARQQAYRENKHTAWEILVRTEEAAHGHTGIHARIWLSGDNARRVLSQRGFLPGWSLRFSPAFIVTSTTHLTFSLSVSLYLFLLTRGSAVPFSFSIQRLCSSPVISTMWKTWTDSQNPAIKIELTVLITWSDVLSYLVQCSFWIRAPQRGWTHCRRLLVGGDDSPTSSAPLSQSWTRDNLGESKRSRRRKTERVEWLGRYDAFARSNWNSSEQLVPVMIAGKVIYSKTLKELPSIQGNNGPETLRAM